MRLALVALLAGGLFGAFPAPAAAAEDEECLACHGDKDLKREKKPAPGRSASLFVDAAALAASTHAALGCTGCHAGATAPHDELPPVRCAACHDDAQKTLAAAAHGSSHAQRSPAPATCAGCHGSHAIKPAASLGTGICAGCHAREARLYQESVHGRSRRQGGSEAATCQSCHGSAHALQSKTSEASSTYHLSLPRTCAQCHADPQLARRHNISVQNAYQLYLDSIHGRALTKSGLLVAANCSDCHGAHDIKPRTDPASRVFRANVPTTCGGCHAGVRSTYAKSVHGQALARGDGNAPVCSDCHTAHQIQRVSATPWELDVIRECGTCHQESLRTYRDTFHGKVTALGFGRVAKCADCHGSHDILPASDQASHVSATNIVATCRQCHPKATFSFTEFHPHADHSDKARFPKLYYSWLLMTALLVGTFVFFGLHTVLWFPRSLVERLRRRRSGRQEGGEA